MTGKRRSRGRSRQAPPSEAEIDARVTALIRTHCWVQLKETMRAYGRRLGLPAQFVLVWSMSRGFGQFLLEHPEAAPQVNADLDAAEEDLIENGKTGRLATLDEIVENLRTAARKYGPSVH